MNLRINNIILLGYEIESWIIIQTNGLVIANEYIIV